MYFSGPPSRPPSVEICLDGPDGRNEEDAIIVLSDNEGSRRRESRKSAETRRSKKKKRTRLKSIFLLNNKQLFKDPKTFKTWHLLSYDVLSFFFYKFRMQKLAFFSVEIYELLF